MVMLKLPIAHTSNLNITIDNGELKLKNALHVSRICKKLLSMKCLVVDLKAYIVVDESDFIVKEKDTIQEDNCSWA